MPRFGKPVKMEEFSATDPAIYEFEMPQLIVGRLIGKFGNFVNKIKVNTGANIIVKKHPTTASLKICAVEGLTNEIEDALEMIRERFPENAFPGLSLARVNDGNHTPTSPVSFFPSNNKLGLVEGVINDVMVSTVVTLDHIFVQQPTHPTYPALSRMHKILSTVYEQPGVPELVKPFNRLYREPCLLLVLLMLVDGLASAAIIYSSCLTTYKSADTLQYITLQERFAIACGNTVDAFASMASTNGMFLKSQFQIFFGPGSFIATSGCFSEVLQKLSELVEQAGVVCVTRLKEKDWVRVEVVAIQEEKDEVTVRLVDIGGYVQVPIDDLRQIRVDFVSIPFQATECRLANLVPLEESLGWSAEALTYFKYLTMGQILQAHVVGYSPGDSTALIHLYRLNTDQTYSLINEEMVNNEFARWVDEIEMHVVPPPYETESGEEWPCDGPEMTNEYLLMRESGSSSEGHDHSSVEGNDQLFLEGMDNLSLECIDSASVGSSEQASPSGNNPSRHRKPSSCNGNADSFSTASDETGDQ